MTDGDTVNFLLSFALLFRIWLVTTQSTCENQMKVFSAFDFKSKRKFAPLERWFFNVDHARQKPKNSNVLHNEEPVGAL